MTSAIIIIVLLGISLYMIGTKQLGYKHPDYMKGYGSRKESVKVLLDRIEWANNHRNRIDYNIRYLFYAIVIALFANIIYQEKEFNCFHILQCTLVVWIVLLRAHTFFYYHADMFSNNFANQNIKHLRKKLKVKSNINNLSIPDKPKNKNTKFFYS